MKKSLLFIGVFLTSLLIFTAGYPFPHGYPTQEVYDTRTDLNDVQTQSDATDAAVLVIQNQGSDTYDSNAEKLSKVIRITYSATDDGGAESTDYDSGIDLPAGAIVVNVWGQVSATFVASDSNTLSVIATPSLTLYTATDLTGTSAGDLISGQATGTLVSSIYNSTAKSIIFVTGSGTAGITSGEAIYNIEYNMGEPGL